MLFINKFVLIKMEPANYIQHREYREHSANIKLQTSLTLIINALWGAVERINKPLSRSNIRELDFYLGTNTKPIDSLRKLFQYIIIQPKSLVPIPLSPLDEENDQTPLCNCKLSITNCLLSLSQLANKSEFALMDKVIFYNIIREVNRNFKRMNLLMIDSLNLMRIYFDICTTAREHFQKKPELMKFSIQDLNAPLEANYDASSDSIAIRGSNNGTGIDISLVIEFRENGITIQTIPSQKQLGIFGLLMAIAISEIKPKLITSEGKTHTLFSMNLNQMFSYWFSATTETLYLEKMDNLFSITMTYPNDLLLINFQSITKKLSSDEEYLKRVPLGICLLHDLYKNLSQ